MSKNFTQAIEDDIRKLHDCGEEAVVIVDDPAKYPPELRNTLDGRTRRWFLKSWPPQRLAPDAEPIYVMLIVDPNIEDISCSGMGKLFIEHKVFKSLQSSITFATHDELDGFVIELAERIKKPVTYKVPIADATLPESNVPIAASPSPSAPRNRNFHASKGYTNEPKRCPACREARKAARGETSSGPRQKRQLFPAVCAQCGKN